MRRILRERGGRTDPAEDLPKEVRPEPRAAERADRPRAAPRHHPMRRLLCDPELRLHNRQDVPLEEGGVCAVHRVVLQRPPVRVGIASVVGATALVDITRLGGSEVRVERAGRNKNGDCRRDFAGVDEIVEGDLAVGEGVLGTRLRGEVPVLSSQPSLVVSSVHTKDRLDGGLFPTPTWHTMRAAGCEGSASYCAGT